MSRSQGKKWIGWLAPGIPGMALLPVVAVIVFGSAGYHAAQLMTPSTDTPQNPPASKHPVHIRRPDGPPAIATDILNAQGLPADANCTTCHATRPRNPRNLAINDGGQLQDFHTGLHTDHGSLSCLSCHNPDDYSSLRKADGTAVPFTDVMQLCAQCHGPQYRDYLHGSHGGMNGHWDLTRGPRTRNNCIDCHDAHAPQYPTVKPAFKPRDRFLSGSGGASGHGSAPGNGSDHE